MELLIQGLAVIGFIGLVTITVGLIDNYINRDQ